MAVSAPRLGIDHRFGDRSGRFHVASIGKAFTATLVMQLVEAGAFAARHPGQRTPPRRRARRALRHAGHHGCRGRRDRAPPPRPHRRGRRLLRGARHLGSADARTRDRRTRPVLDARRPARLHAEPPAAGRPAGRAVRVLQHGLHPPRPRARAGDGSRVPRAPARAHLHPARHARQRAPVPLATGERRGRRGDVDAPRPRPTTTATALDGDRRCGCCRSASDAHEVEHVPQRELRLGGRRHRVDPRRPRGVRLGAPPRPADLAREPRPTSPSRGTASARASATAPA